MSIGIICSSCRDSTLEELLNKVDNALYKAKQMGRDRIIEYSPEDLQDPAAADIAVVNDQSTSDHSQAQHPDA